MEDSYRNRLVLSHSVRDTRIFGEQILRSSMTQGNARARNAAELLLVKLRLVTLSDHGLGTGCGGGPRDVGALSALRIFEYEGVI